MIFSLFVLFQKATHGAKSCRGLFRVSIDLNWMTDRSNRARLFIHWCSGVLDFREFIAALSVTSRGSFEEKVKFMFDIYDIDGDGFITRDEMLAIMRVSCC